ncbi:hypothetical protein [Phage f2b1]|nr:hypothetical protein [Phage f2b1]
MSDKLHDTSRLDLMEHEDATVYDIGGEMTVTMRQGANGFYGHYTSQLTNKTHTFEAPGMSRKQVIKTFWNWVKDNPVGGE